MARQVTSPCNAAYNVEGWSRLTTGYEVVLDTTTPPFEGTGSYITQGDGANKNSSHSITNSVSGGMLYIQWRVRLASLPTASGAISGAPYNGSSFPAGQLYFDASGNLANIGIVTGGVNEDPTPTPLPWTAATWVKVTQAFRLNPNNSRRIEIWTWINDNFYGRATLGSSSGVGTLNRFFASAGSTATPQVNIDDLKINDESTTIDNFFPDGVHPTYKTAPSAGGVNTPPTVRSQVITGNASGSAATSFVANAPPTISQGDLLTAIVIQRTGGTVTMTAPTGWIKKFERTSMQGWYIGVYQKRATNGEPATYTWTSNFSARWAVHTLSIQNGSSVSDAWVHGVVMAQSNNPATVPTVYDHNGDCLSLQGIMLQRTSNTATLSGYPAANDQIAFDDPAANTDLTMKAGTRIQTAGGFSKGDGTSTASTTSATTFMGWQVLVTPQTPFQQEVLKDNPSAYWEFDELAGTSAADLVGANTGTYVNSPTLGATGLASGTAVTYAAASSQEATLPGPALSTDFAEEIVFKWTAGTAIFRDNTTAGGTGWIIYDNSGTFYVRVAGTDINTGIPTAQIRDGTRHHVVVGRTGTNTHVYVDGRLVKTQTVSSALPAIMPWHVSRNGSAAGQYSDATVDGIALYASEISASRVLAHFNAMTPKPFGLISSGSTSSFTNTGTSRTVNTPVANVGDILFAFYSDRTYTNPTPPVGWTPVDTDPGSASIGITRIWYRVVDGTEAASYTWTNMGSDRQGIVISRAVNVDTTTPVDSWARATISAGSSLDTPSLTPTKPGCLYVGMASASTTVTVNFTETASMSEVVDSGAGSSMSIVVAQELLPGTSASGTRNFVPSNAPTNIIGESMLLRPGVGGTTQTGSLSLSANGLFALTASAEHRASLALSGAGSFALGGSREQHGSANLSAQGAFAIGGLAERHGALALSGVGALTLAPMAERHAALSLAAKGTLLLSGSNIILGSAAFSAHSSMNAAGLAERLGSLHLSANGLFTANPNIEHTASIALIASGAFYLNAELAIDIPVEHYVAQTLSAKNLRLLGQDGSLFYPIIPDQVTVVGESLVLSKLDEVVKVTRTRTPQTITISDYNFDSSDPMMVRMVASDETHIVVIAAE